MKIFIEDYELIHSGTVIQIKNYPIKVILPDKIEGDYTFIFNFMTDSKEKEIVTRYSQIDKFTLSVDLVNFNKSPNVGNTELVEVGTLNNIPLYLNYRVSNLGNTGKTLTFNFFLRKGGQDAN